MKTLLITTVAALTISAAAFADTKIIAPVVSTGLVDSSGNAVTTQNHQPVAVAQPTAQVAPVVAAKPVIKPAAKHSTKHKTKATKKAVTK